MTFSEYLNECMLKAHCNARELSEVSGLSQAVISRYRSGDRTPALDSEQLKQIIYALVQLSSMSAPELSHKGPDADSQKDTSGPLLEAELSKQFSEILRDDPGSALLVTDNLNAILTAANVNTKKLAKFISYDPSYISRIRSRQRRPSNPITFARDVSRYLTQNYDKEKLTEIIQKLSGPENRTPKSIQALEEALNHLLVRQRDIDSSSYISTEKQESPAVSFVRKLSEYTLDEYIRAMHFDKMHIPITPIQLPAVKVYYGIEEMKQGELDFFRQTLLSRSKDPIYMCSDMAMDHMTQDLEFTKKWMLAIAAAVKKGLRLNIIHSLDRPLNEMMLGLESWIPLYMTGQLSSYYLTSPKDNVYAHLHYSSGSSALSGECIQDHHASGRYHLTNNKRDVLFYRKYCIQLFSKAKSLMVVFTRQSSDRYESFLASSASIPGVRRMILSVPPLACMSTELLDRILERCGKKEMAGQIRPGISFEKRLLKSVLEHDLCEIEISSLTRDEFDQHPAALSLSGIFPDENICYSWEEYQEHLSQTQAFVQSNPRCTLTVTDRPGFRNIRIHIVKGHWVMVSRNVSPAIHFVIRHPRLRAAFENMVLPIVES